MTRAEAEAAVSPVTYEIAQGNGNPPFLAVSHRDVESLLGAERFLRLQRDPIRRHGPVAGTVYPWNVADYLQCPDLRIKEEQEKPQ